MKKSTLLLIPIVSILHMSFADDLSNNTVMDHQLKHTDALHQKILELEQEISTIKSVLVRSGLMHDKAMQKDHNTHNVEQKNTSSPIRHDGIQPPNYDENTEYSLALATLKDGDYNSAENKFADFIQKYPDSSLQSNATFWYAEIFYRQGMYHKAAIHYLQSYKKYPKGNKSPDALLKLSYSLIYLKKAQEACSILDKLESEFPNCSPDVKKRSQDAIIEFQCNRISE